MAGFVQGVDREQVTLFPARLDEYVAEDNPVPGACYVLHNVGVRRS